MRAGTLTSHFSFLLFHQGWKALQLLKETTVSSTILDKFLKIWCFQ
ncbi:unnamed protein product [Brugia timori]|uniref:Uncharacterized protein n=1 Tax=Brugia timori TaxID=42155 RepID=A0A0R3Q9D5_9BILA|nr:unnamed protein product [Brugia timori]